MSEDIRQIVLRISRETGWATHLEQRIVHLDLPITSEGSDEG